MLPPFVPVPMAIRESLILSGPRETTSLACRAFAAQSEAGRDSAAAEAAPTAVRMKLRRFMNRFLLRRRYRGRHSTRSITAPDRGQCHPGRFAYNVQFA